MTIEVVPTETPGPSVGIYPIGAEAVEAVFDSLFKDFVNKPWEKYLKIKKPMLEEGNPYANQYLMEIGDSISEEEGLGFKIGVTIAYEIFKERAKRHRLPMLSSTFVELYDEMRKNRMVAVYGENPGTQVINAAREEEVRKGLFAMAEKEAYRVLEKRMTNPGDSILNNTIFSGIVASYFLFAEGFSDSGYCESD